jgi:hypothetical protein
VAIQATSLPPRQQAATCLPQPFQLAETSLRIPLHQRCVQRANDKMANAPRHSIPQPMEWTPPPQPDKVSPDPPTRTPSSIG